MTAAAVPAAEPAHSVGDLQAWIAVGAATMATFMALLDVTVTNASLPQIQGAIGASGTEGTWIGTAYLAAEVAMIPLTSWFTRMLGLRLFLTVAVVAFGVFSIMCGMAESLPMMILGRTGQGFAGGALVPAGLVIVASRLTDAQKRVGLAAYATTAVLAPVVGPPVGGWLTENASWAWLFYMNVPICVLIVALLAMGISREPVREREFFRADWLGVAGLIVGLACLVILLEEGQRENWFESGLIVRLALATAAGFAMVGYSQLTSRRPVLKLKLLGNRAYAAGFICCLAGGAGSFSGLYLVPTFLGNIAGYDAEQTGIVALYSGITGFLFMPFLAWMLGRVDNRLMIGVGLITFAVANFLDVRTTAATVGMGFLLSQLIRGGSQMLMNLPLSQGATQGLSPEDIPDGAALFTIARNLGGAVGLALVGVLLDRRYHFHLEQLGQRLTANTQIAAQRFGEVAGMMGSGDAEHDRMQAVGLIANELHRQSLVMAYTDSFWAAGILLIVVTPLVLLIPKLKVGAGGLAH